MLVRFRIITIALMFASCARAAPAQQRIVALTFDDLPAAVTSSADEARAFNLSILDSLDRHHAPAIGFVIERRVQELAGADLLDEWVKRGYDLGNHSLSHIEMNNLTTDQFEQEIIGGEGAFVAALAKAGKKPRYFRFPENHTGDTKEKHDAVAAFLAQRGYRLAPCTIDNEDYVFNVAYLKMLANKDGASAARLRADYLAYTSTEIDFYAGLHRQIFGHEIPHVMLLHVNKLNADVIDSVLALFLRKQYRFVSLDTALSDPAYATVDEFVTKEGWMWAYRWAKELGVHVNGSAETEPPDWIFHYRK
ncbi:MAG: polysaccharide deacetylase family protein [Candidatus Sulfotelmatobacter sp.]